MCEPVCSTQVLERVKVNKGLQNFYPLVFEFLNSPSRRRPAVTLVAAVGFNLLQEDSASSSEKMDSSRAS